MKRRLATVCKWWGQDLARRRCEASARWAAKLLRLWQEGAAQSVEGKSRVSVLRGLLRDHFVHEAEALFLSAAVREQVTGEPPPSGVFLAATRRRQQQVAIDSSFGPREHSGSGQTFLL